MKKIVVVLAVLLVVLTVAPWGVGRVAEKRLNRGLDQLSAAAPYLKVVERKWTPGWFKSEQLVTFEVTGPFAALFSTKAIEAVMKKGSADAAEAMPSEAPAAAAPEASAESDAAIVPSPDWEPRADAAPEAEPASTGEPARFSVRNEVLHGPVLGLAGLGIARVDTHLVLSEETREDIAKIFGPQAPFEVSTRVGFLGGGTTTFKSEGRTLKPDDNVEVSWDTAKLAIGYSRNADKYDMDGRWPRIEFKDLDDRTHFVMSDMTLDGDGKRVRGDLYDGDFNFAIDKLSVVGKDDDSIEVLDLHYVVNSGTKDDFTEMGTRLGTGTVKNKQLTTMGVEIKEIHYDLSVRRLHAATLEKMLAGIKAAYATPLTLEANKVMFAPFKESGVELLKYDPELVIDRIGLATADGDGYIKGVIRLQGATADDFANGSMALIGKIHADITIDVSEKMLQKFPNGSTGAGAAVDSGYAERKGERLICKITFTKGALTVNGKPQAIPGLGGPPPVPMDHDDMARPEDTQSQ